MQSSPYQFGFKARHGTDSCIFGLKEVIGYYLKSGSPVLVSFLDVKSAFDRVRYTKLFIKLIERGAPVYLVALLYQWYKSQFLVARWGSSVSEPFKMANGIRQGSVLSPYLFSVYVDGLNAELSRAKVGCHVAGVPMNNFSYADDIAIVGPSAKAVNKLLEVCDSFANRHDIMFSTTKSVCMLVQSRGVNRVRSPPEIILSGEVLEYVHNFKYLGHIITDNLSDNDDIMREVKSLYCRGNLLIRKFKHVGMDIKCALFKAYCFSMYTAALWCNFTQGILYRLKVCYNSIMRRLAGVPRWESARNMFVQLRVRSFEETMRCVCYSLMSRVDVDFNPILWTLHHCNAFLTSDVQHHWTIFIL